MNDTLRTIRWLFVFKAIIWVVLAAGFYLTQRQNTEPNTHLIITVLLFLDAALYLFFGWALGWRKGWVLVLALGFLTANAILTFTDQVGLVDIIMLLMDLTIVALLVTCWRVFFPARGA